MTNNIESTAHRKPRQPLFAIPAVIHWHGLTDTQSIKRTTEIIKYFFCVGLIFICIFVVSIILMGGATRLISVAGFFIPAHIIQRYSTPVWSVNAPTAHEVIDNGKGCTVLYYSPNIKFMDLSITEKKKSTKSAEIGTYVPEIKNLHAGSRQSVINGLFNRPINQLVHDFVVEMDAKNTAYYFILENGHFDAFADYCRNQRKEVCHVNA